MGSALRLGLAGMVLIFMPDTLLYYLPLEETVLNTYLLQLLSALYFSFALLNWMSRSAITSGIYNRPM
jgi:hypothetical protein